MYMSHEILRLLPLTFVYQSSVQMKSAHDLKIHYIIQLCKHIVAKVTLVPCSVNITGERDKVGHGEVTINNARIIVMNGNVCK